MAILSFLLPIFFLLLGFGEILSVKFLFVASTSVIDFVLVLIIIYWLFFIKKSKNYDLGKPILIFILVAIFSLVINIFNYTNNQFLISSLYLVRFIMYSLIYFVFVDIGKKFNKLIPKYLLISGAIFLTFGFFQYFLFPSLKEFYFLGWDIHENRLFSTFFDPNFAGIFLVLIFIFTYITKDEIFSKSFKFLAPIFLIFNFIAILLTFSRGAYLMLIVGVITYAIINKAWKPLIVISILFFTFFFIAAPNFNLESTNLLRSASIENRLNSNKDALNIYKQNKLGVGFNTYRYAREKYSEYPLRGLKVSNAGAGVDNSFMFVLVTMGFLGLISYIYFIYKMLKLGYTNSKNNKYALVLIISISGLVVNALTINSLFYSFIMLWIFILAGFTESSLRE